MKEIKEGIQAIGGCISQIENGPWVCIDWETRKQLDSTNIIAGLREVRTLAERYLAVEAKMPEKWIADEDGQGYEESQYYNQAIDDCTIAITKMLDRERIRIGHWQ